MSWLRTISMSWADKRLNSSSSPSRNLNRPIPWISRTALLVMIASSLLLRLRMNVGGKAEVEPDRLHYPEDGAPRVDVGRSDHAGVLLDDRCRAGVSPGVKQSTYRGAWIVTVFLKERCRVDADQGLPDAGVHVGHVLLVQGHVVARAEPADVASDEVLPRIIERDGRSRDVARNVFGEVAHRDRCPSRVDDVDQHQGVVVRKVDVDVVRGVIRPAPFELDAFATDFQRAAVSERLLRRRPGGVVVPHQQTLGLLVSDADHFLVEERRCSVVVTVVVPVHEAG